MGSGVMRDYQNFYSCNQKKLLKENVEILKNISLFRKNIVLVTIKVSKKYC